MLASGCPLLPPSPPPNSPDSFRAEARKRRDFLESDVAQATFFGSDALIDHHGATLTIRDHALLSDLQHLFTVPAPPREQDLAAKTDQLELLDSSGETLLRTHFLASSWGIDFPPAYENVMRRVADAEARTLASEVKGMMERETSLTKITIDSHYALTEPHQIALVLSLLESGDPALYSYTARETQALSLRLMRHEKRSEVHIVLPAGERRALDVSSFRNERSRQAIRLLQKYVDLEGKAVLSPNVDGAPKP